jgi:hypothetical protein
MESNSQLIVTLTVTPVLRVSAVSTFIPHELIPTQSSAMAPQHFDKDPERVTAKLVQTAYSVIDVGCPASDNHRPSFMQQQQDGGYSPSNAAHCKGSVVTGSGRHRKLVYKFKRP